MAELLAKPDVPLLFHLEEVIRLGAEIAERMRLPPRLRAKALLACALHDIGKATRGFQDYMRALRMVQEAEQRGAPAPEQERLRRIARQRKARAYPHALASLPIVLAAEGNLPSGPGESPSAFEATAAVLSHHSPLGPELYKGYESLPDYLWDDLPDLLRALWELMYEHGVDELPALKDIEPQIRILARQTPAALLEQPLSFGNEFRTLRGTLQRLPPQDFARVKTVLHLADWLASAKSPCPSALFLSAGTLTVQRSMETRGQSLRDFQRRAQSAADREILLLRAPTGTGKTEALLLWAGRAERIIYLLPTQATTNAMWRRLRGIYGNDAVGLAHGRASYMLRREFDEDPLDLRLFGSVFAKPVTVATLDQYLLAHLHGRHWEERRSLARGATLILDEIHAYEPYTLGLLLEALSREPPARLALASATLPDPLLQLFPPGEPVDAEPDLWARRRHRIRLCGGRLTDHGLEIAMDLARKGKTVLVIANTVRDARQLYRQLREAHRWPQRALLHSRFTLADRARKEEEAQRPQPGTILIATQVVEVSLDISYDAMITEIAPMDALVQRMGRVNRQGIHPPAPVWICQDWSEGAQRVYGREILLWSRELLEALPETPSDADLAHAVQQLYERVMSDPAWQRELEDGRAAMREIQQILGCYTIDLSDEEMKNRFTARRGTLSIEVLPEVLASEADALRERGEMWRLPELLVPVPIYWLKEHGTFFTPRTDLGCFQTALPYHPEEGLQEPEPQTAGPRGVIVE